MRAMCFYGALVTLFILGIVLGYLTGITSMLHPQLKPLLFHQWGVFLNIFALLGIGTGLPAIVIASLLGWGHFILLIKGDVAPHLAKDGFVDTLNTLLSRL